MAYIELDCPASVKKQLLKLFEVSLRTMVPDEPDVVPLVDACAAKSGVKFADYQCNNAMSLFAKIKGKQTGFGGPPAIGQAILNNLPPSEMIESCSVAGPGYADLRINRLTNYTFSFDQMRNDKGNTAVYLQYAHARICFIMRKSGKDIEELKRNGKVVLDHEDERAFGLHLIQFSELEHVFEESLTNLLPNVLCEYLYNLTEMFIKKFYNNCQVVGSPQETSRLLLCEATVTVMRQCFYLLGIEPVYRL